MKNWLKVLLITVGSFVFYLLTGDIGSSALLLVILLYLEFRFKNKA
jgi:hypothetical protein